MKRIEKSLILVVVMALGMLFFSGCDTTSGERIAALNSAIATAQEISTSYDAQAETIKAAMPDLEAAIADANLPADMQAKAVNTLNLLKEKLLVIQAEKAKVDLAITNYEKAIANIDANSPDFNTELQMYGTGLQQLAPLTGVYGGWFYLIGLGLTTIGGIGAAMKKSADAAKKQKQLDQVVTGNQIYMDSNPSVIEAFKAVQSQIQTADTVAAVKAIKNL